MAANRSLVKKVKLVPNSAGGIDLLTERDSGNEVLILTGRRECSSLFWRKLLRASAAALRELKGQSELDFVSAPKA